MDTYLVRCEHCGKIYKAHREGNELVTDYGDNITKACLNCQSPMSKMMKTEDWVADLFFKIKGKK